MLKSKMAKKIALGKILICDDSSDTRALLKVIFSSEGYAIIEATNGAMAQDLAEKLLPDLIVIDLVMPEQDGITTVKNLKSNPATQNIPVFMITGKAKVTQLLEEYKGLINDIIEKPFQVKEIKSKVKDFLGA